MAGAPDPGPRLAARLTYQLKHALLDLDDLHRAQLAPLGLTGRELALLLHLEGRPPASQQQVAQRLAIDRTTMVALLDSLQGSGFVGRRPDIDDRRRNVVEVTEAGRRVLRRALRASDEAERQLLAGLDPGERATLRDLLRRVASGRSGPDHG